MPAIRLTFASLRSLLRDRRGLGGVEFAIVTPLLIMIYVGAFELSLGFTVAGKAARASSAVADLVSQQTDVNKTYLGNMSNVVKSILAPYEGSKYTLKITGIKVDAANTGTVVWSRDQDGAVPYAVNSTTTVPTQFTATEAFIVRTELSIEHELLMFAPSLASSTKTVNLSKTAYFRSRQAETIKCSDC
ncbi:TadE/TadG family type IV pilus assembly protein [Ensifer sp. 4252]|uniref:TadE/TadG family type IV pilus assembly protein n=1 Tax=Ensifer sp. 4252 TaxID=3373915 RepID=UPI003D24067A